MNRVASLQRVLRSIEAANYEKDDVTLVIKIDHSSDNKKVIILDQNFIFSHGKKDCRSVSSQ